MAEKYTVELNSSGVRDLLKSPEMEAYLKRIADDMKHDCGSGYETDTKQMGTRVIASVYTDTYEAMKRNYETNELLKAASRTRE